MPSDAYNAAAASLKDNLHGLALAGVRAEHHGHKGNLERVDENLRVIDDALAGVRADMERMRSAAS